SYRWNFPPAAALRVSNFSGQYGHLIEIDEYIAPGQKDMLIPVSGLAAVSFKFEAPPGLTQPAPVSGQVCLVYTIDEAIGGAGAGGPPPFNPGFIATPFNDSQAYPDECDPTHPFHFDIFIPSNLAEVTAARLSFFLQPFRAEVQLNTSQYANIPTTFSNNQATRAGSEALANFTGATAGEAQLHTHPDPQGGNTGTESAVHQHQGVPTAITDVGITVLTGITGTTVVVTSAGLSYGIFESSSPTGV